MAKKDELTDKQLAFIDAYLESFNATKAYIEAGYSTNTKYIGKRAYEVLNNPKVKEELNRRMEELRMDNELVIQKMIRKSMDIMDDDEQKTADVIKSMEFLMKLLGLGQETINVNAKTDENAGFVINIQSVNERVAEDELDEE